MSDTNTSDLRHLLAYGQRERAAQEVVRRCAAGENVADVAGELLAFVATAVGDWPRLLIATADALRVAQSLEPRRRGLPLGQVAAAAADVLRSGVVSSAAVGAPTTEQTVLGLIELVSNQPERFAQFAPPVAALAELNEVCSQASIEPFIARLYHRMQAQPVPESAELQEHVQRLDMLQDQWQRIHDAADPDKAAKFQEPKFRRHLVDSSAETAFRAMAKALAFGVPRQLVAGSVGLAMAERVLRFDSTLVEDARWSDDWSDVVAGFELVAATMRLLRRHDQPNWLRLLLTVGWLVNRQAALDAPTTQRYVLPEPEAIAQTWDHGPEIAKVQASLLAGDTDRAIALVRGYLLMVLPVQPLCQQMAAVGFEDIVGTAQAQLLASSALSSGVEIFSVLGEHPHRELPLCAASRLATAPLASRAAHRLGLAVIDQLDGLSAPRSRAARLWT